MADERDLFRNFADIRHGCCRRISHCEGVTAAASKRRKLMQKDIRITVVTVAFNAREALETTIRNVAGQDYANLEYIVIDGGSADGSLEVIERHAADITRWVSEPDRGIYDAMNKGVAMATGDYCIFMNAGDTFVAPDTVNTVVAGMERGDDVVYGDIVKNGVLKTSLAPRNCHKMFYCHQSAFTSTACLLAFPFDTAHRYSADFKQAKQLILAGKRFRHLPVAVAHFDTHGVSNTQRSKGLWDNVKVVRETDSFVDKCRFLPHLLWPWLMCKLRGK